MTPSPAVEVAVARGGDARRSYVRSMFTAIAPRYDFLNHLLSLNVDRRWRHAAAARVLKPGARFVVLEFATPRRRLLRALYLFYFRRLLPAIGRAVSKHRDAYTYLPASVLEFPEPDALARRLETAGFRDVAFELLSGGICAVHHGAR